MGKRIRILLVDAGTSNLEILSRIFSSSYNVLTAVNGAEALSRAVKEQPDLILLDILLPDSSGFEVLRRLKEMPETTKIPVILTASLSSDEDEERGLLMGAVDYFTKPFRKLVVRARVMLQIENIKQRRKLERMSTIDALTEIPNRRGFDIRLNVEWNHAIREKLPLSMLMMDLDNFKIYNDTYGHPQGDTLLKAVAEVFHFAAKRAEDIAARLGGEEFAVLLPNTGLDGALLSAERIRAKVERMVVPTVDGKPTRVTISIGVAVVKPKPGDDMAELITRADECLYAAKEAGRNRVHHTG
ncbi:MAG: diguanylate cyclase [Treponema sp.]|jgi:diguanylate cyclase (GGDEF)-like protein|nr:diguanylate cyclase [Treponema sp.]